MTNKKKKKHEHEKDLKIYVALKKIQKFSFYFDISFFLITNELIIK